MNLFTYSVRSFQIESLFEDDVGSFDNGGASSDSKSFPSRAMLAVAEAQPRSANRERPPRAIYRRRRRLSINFEVWMVCFILAKEVMNFTTLFRRLNIRELVSNTLVYNYGSDAYGEGLRLVLRRWATKKTPGSTKNGRDSKPKNLGVKKFGGERVIPGNIIVRQRGTRFHPGDYVGIGNDLTLYALKEGCVKFERNKLTGRKWVHVEPKDGHVLHPIYSTAADPELKTAT
nr:50S ribosomal protein L27-like [Ipomoea batatas]